MTREQKAFLARRLGDAVKVQPELKRLKSVLLRLGGDFLVAPPNPDPDVSALLVSGFTIGSKVIFKPMKSSSCHENVASLWRGRKFDLIGIATGYALSEDGLWRQHSWGVLRDGVLETTEVRVKYFGIVLQGKSADRFAGQN